MSVKQDVFFGITTSAVATVATNGLLHRQYCHVMSQNFLFRDCWRGLTPNFNSYVGCFMVGSLAKGAMNRYLVKHHYPMTDVTKLGVGALAGGISAFGVVTGEYFALKDNATGNGFMRNVLIAYREEGIRALSRGIGPTIFRDMIAMGVFFGGGEVSKNYFVQRYGFREPTALLTSSLVAGLISAGVTQPLQTIRINIQSHRNVTIKKAILKIWCEQGPLGFMSGLTSRAAINIILVGCSLFVDDKIKKFSTRHF